jgi:DNA polymerase III, alpha subunit
MPEVEAWPIEQSLAGERETLGHYLSGHPTDAWRDLIAKVATCPIGEIDKHYKAPPPDRQFRYADQQTFTLVGAVMGIRKQGDSRVFVQVEDFLRQVRGDPVSRGLDRIRSAADARRDPRLRRRSSGR